MATWGEFIAEIPIINKRSEGIFVKADHVLDLWEERNRLRAELAALKSSSGEAGPPAADAPSVPLAAPVDDDAGPAAAALPLAAPVAEEGTDAAAREREQCAREIEEFAQSCPVDPAWRELAVQLLQTAAQLLREKGNREEMDFMANVVIPPAVEAIPSAEMVNPEETVPMAEPIAENSSSTPE